MFCINIFLPLLTASLKVLDCSSTRRNCSINCDSISQPLLLRYFEVRINGTKRKFLILFYLYDQMQTPPLFIVIFGIQEAGRGIGLHSRPLSPLPGPQLLCFIQIYFPLLKTCICSPWTGCRIYPTYLHTYVNVLKKQERCGKVSQSLPGLLIFLGLQVYLSFPPMCFSCLLKMLKFFAFQVTHLTLP